MNSHILIRADVGPKVGTGHVMRSSALASAFLKLGGQATMACDRIPATLRQRLEKLGIAVQTISPTSQMDDAIQTRQIAEDLEADWIVVDGYDFDDEYQQILKLSLAHLMVVDDYGHSTHRLADLILNQNVYAQAADYAIHPDQVICGAKFALMRSEFSAVQPDSRIPKHAKRILLTFGGADEGDFTSRCLKAIADIKGCEDFFVETVVGNCNPHHQRLKRLIKDLPFNTILHRNVDRMTNLFSRCDMAITAGGSTCYELARCGVPTLVVSTAENQRAVAESFSERGAMAWLGDADQVTQELLTEQISKLSKSQKRRTDLAKQAVDVVDGQGAQRIARRLLETQLVFRTAEIADAEQLLKWRNEPAARLASFRSEEVQPAGHQSWLAKTLANRLIDLWIVEVDDEPIGQVRFDFDSTSESAKISVSLALEHRKRGLGTALIEAACRKTFMNDDVEEIVALIKSDNQASLNAFRKAGFVNPRPIAIHGQDAKRVVLQRESLLPLTNETTSSARWRKSA
jgi:UDP-2,4-diacetamido-2,4,6-trideoxy-beta-L-altropyranose hydrolase